MHEERIEIVSVSQSSSRRRMTFLVDAVLGGCGRLQERLNREFDDVEALVGCEENVAVVAAVGDGAANSPAALARMLAVLDRSDVPVLATNQQSSNAAMVVVVPESTSDKAVQVVHDAFIRPTRHRRPTSARRRQELLGESLRVG
jgi:aspartokinase